MFQKIAFLRVNFIYELAEVEVWQTPPAPCSCRAVTHQSTNPAEQGAKECLHCGRRFIPLSPTQIFFKYNMHFKKSGKKQKWKAKGKYFN